MKPIGSFAKLKKKFGEDALEKLAKDAEVQLARRICSTPGHELVDGEEVNVTEDALAHLLARAYEYGFVACLQGHEHAEAFIARRRASQPWASRLPYDGAEDGAEDLVLVEAAKQAAAANLLRGNKP